MNKLTITNIKDKEPDKEKRYIDLEEFIKEIEFKIEKFINITAEKNLLQSSKLINLQANVYKFVIDYACRIAKKGK